MIWCRSYVVQLVDVLWQACGVRERAQAAKVCMCDDVVLVWSSRGYKCRRVTCGAAAARYVLLHMIMPHSDGERVCQMVGCISLHAEVRHAGHSQDVSFTCERQLLSPGVDCTVPRYLPLLADCRAAMVPACNLLTLMALTFLSLWATCLI